VARYLIGVLALACVCMLVLSSDRSVAKDDNSAASMRFDWRVEGPAEKCDRNCRIWVSAVGIITEDTPRDFDKFAKEHDLQGATLVLESEGGSVLSALALGRAIRRLDMTTEVGKTITLPADEDGVPRARLSPKANCESMCVFMLLGGARRYVPTEAHVMVHQIWLGAKAKRALESTYSAQELRTVQRDVGSLARYTVEMGGDMELLETALQVPPWEPMHLMNTDELRRVKLTNTDQMFEPAVPLTTSSIQPAASNIEPPPLTPVSHVQAGD
jgi:hypothetical protein